MSKFRDIFQGEHKNFRIFFAVSTAIFILIWIVGPGNTWIHWAKAGLEIKRQERQIQVYQQEIDAMEERVKVLKTDRDSLEKFAREEYHMHADGETVYIVE